MTEEGGSWGSEVSIMSSINIGIQGNGGDAMRSTRAGNSGDAMRSSLRLGWISRDHPTPFAGFDNLGALYHAPQRDGASSWTLTRSRSGASTGPRNACGPRTYCWP